MVRKLVLTLIAVLGLMASVSAQNRQVSGTVKAADGTPLPGVTVIVDGSNIGTSTNINGEYSLDIRDGRELRFSFIGMQSQVVPVNNRSTINVIMHEDAIGMDEVVVTGMGISKVEKTLGYSATTLKTDELTESRNTDVVNSLAGKVAGVQVSSTSTDPGAANSIIIRGVSSIAGGNQPLYVIDGVPMQSITFGVSNGDNTLAAGISNVNADDIESLTILKGAAATAIYGSRASAGVVVITTRQGSKRGFELEVNSGVQFSTIAMLPRFQNVFGLGWNGDQTFNENGSWGPAMDGSMQVYGPVYNNSQLLKPYSPLPNNVRDFFETGVMYTNSISFSGGNEKTNYYASYSNVSDDGSIPGDYDTYKRNTFAFRGSHQANDWLKISSSVNFSTQKTKAVATAQGISMIDGLYEMPRDISIVDLRDLNNPFNQPYAYYTPYGITNPYWVLANSYHHLDTKKLFGKLQLDINPIKDLTLTYRFGFDYTDSDSKAGVPQLEIETTNNGQDYSSVNQDGYVSASYYRIYEWNHDFMANYSTRFAKDFEVNATVGLNMNQRGQTGLGASAKNLGIFTGFWDLSNGSTPSVSETQYKRRMVGLFADAQLGWRDMLYLNLTARNDWSSTLPIGNNSFFYPGATLSWIFTELIKKNDVLSFGKVRLAYGKTGKDANTYVTSAGFTQGYTNGVYGGSGVSFPIGNVNAFQKLASLGSQSLQPEMTTEFEIGANMQFFNGRLGFDAAYYNRKTDMQIFNLPVDPASGYSSMTMNFGAVRNTGFELLVNTTPVRTKNFRWDVDFNFAINRNKVLSLPESLEGGRVMINGFQTSNDAVYMYAEAGMPMGVLYTYLPEKITEGPYAGYTLVDQYGQPIINKDPAYTGYDVNNKWTGGITTSFSFYGVSIGATLDVRYGGKMFSRSKNLMQFTGNGIETLYNDRNPFVIPNSVQLVNGEYVENTTPIFMSDGSFQDYFDAYGNGEGGLAFLIDRSFVKLRNLTVSYDLPKRWVSAIGLRGVKVSFVANNLFTWTASDNYHIDPELSTEGTDIGGMFGEMYANPSSRKLGFNVQIKF